MKQYARYGLADFMQDDDFRDWVRGQKARESFWLSFRQRYPQTGEAFRQAEQLIRAATVAPEQLSEAEIRREAELLIQNAVPYTIDRYPMAGPDRPGKGHSWFRPVARQGMAALLVVVIGVSWYVFTNGDSPVAFVAPLPAAPIPSLVETINPTKQPIRVVLNDGSEVVLSPQSSLRYPAQFSATARIVYLKGEGSFSVKRRNGSFLVHAGGMVTKVLGTRFVVRAFDRDRKITVRVLSGKVSVYTPKPEAATGTKEVNGLILNANQAAIYEKSDGNLTKTVVANPFLVGQTGKPPQFVYDEVPLPVILRELETGYAIPIQFDEQRFEGCRITASLASESLYEKLDILCKAASARYEITDGQIVISREAVD